MPSKRSAKHGHRGSSKQRGEASQTAAAGSSNVSVGQPKPDGEVIAGTGIAGPTPSNPAQRVAPSSPMRPASPTAAQQREQQLMQQQVYQHQLQLLRLAQQQRAVFPLTEVLRTGFMFLVAVVSAAIVFREYGWTMALAVMCAMYVCGLFSFLSVVARWLFKTVDTVSYNEALRRADIMTEPIIKKTTHSGENVGLSFGCSCMQGWRRTMEDAHTTTMLEEGGFFGVYDGHSGSGTSKFCGANMYNSIAGTKAFGENNFPTAMFDGFLAIDRHLLETHSADRSGCTAVTLLVRGDDLFCANAGDSRCVLCRDGEAVPLSVDHKPFLPAEQARIERAGGYVWSRRVNGILALSRAIGDFSFKQNTQVPWDQQAVTSAPEVRTARLNRDKDEFAVLACDGIWDVMTSEQVVQFVRARLQQRMPLGKICELLMDSCLSPQPFGLGCDNMSVIIVQFKRTGSGSAAIAPTPPLQVGIVQQLGSPSLGSQDAQNAAVTVAATEDHAPLPRSPSSDPVPRGDTIAHHGGPQVGSPTPDMEVLLPNHHHCGSQVASASQHLDSADEMSAGLSTALGDTSSSGSPPDLPLPLPKHTASPLRGEEVVEGSRSRGSGAGGGGGHHKPATRKSSPKVSPHQPIELDKLRDAVASGLK